MTDLSLLTKLSILLLLITLMTGPVLALLKKRSIWVLTAQLISLKALVALVMLLTDVGGFSRAQANLFLLPLLAAGPLFFVVGILVLHKARICGDGSNWDDEKNLYG